MDFRFSDQDHAQKIREAERRQAHAVRCPSLPPFPSPLAGERWEGGRKRAAPTNVAIRQRLRARSPIGASPRRLSQRANARTQPRPRFTRNKRDTQALPAPSFAFKRSTPHAGRTAGRDDARTAREQAATLARRNRTRPMFRCASRTRPLPSEILYLVTGIGTIVKVTSSVK